MEAEGWSSRTMRIKRGVDRIGAEYQGGAVRAGNHCSGAAGVADHHGRADRAEDAHGGTEN